MILPFFVKQSFLFTLKIKFMKHNYFKFLFVSLFILTISETIQSQTWTSVFKNGSNGVSDVSFLNDNIGIVSCGYTYFTTNDGGKTWTEVAYFWPGPNVKAVKWLSTNVVLMGAENGKVYKSTDAGKTFTQSAAPVGDIRDMDIIGNTGILCDNYCYAAYSSDAGDTWTQIPSSALCNNASTLNKVDMINSSTAVISGRNGNKFKTTNGGAEWITLGNDGASVNGIDFVNETTGYLLTYCQKSNSEKTCLYKTLDGGSTWIDISTGMLAEMRSASNTGLAAVDANTIYITANSKIYKSVNGGTSFALDFTPDCSGCDYMNFSRGGNSLYVCSSNGTPNTRVYRLGGVFNSIDEKTKLQFNIYPNPSNSVIIVSGINSQDNYSVEITDIFGKQIYYTQLNGTTVNIENLSNGMYFLKLTDSKGFVGTQKVIKN